MGILLPTGTLLPYYSACELSKNANNVWLYRVMKYLGITSNAHNTSTIGTAAKSAIRLFASSRLHIGVGLVRLDVCVVESRRTQMAYADINVGTMAAKHKISTLKGY